MNIGQKIKDARIKKGLTQEELGSIIGVQKSAIAKYESGRVINIKRSTLQKLAVALDMKGSDLVIEQEEPEDLADFVSRIISSPVTVEYIKKYLLLTKEQQVVVRSVIDSLISPNS
mgnify:CR=1 FL=1